MSGSRVLGVVAIGTLLSSLGQSLVNVALPRIAETLDADRASASWVLTSYSLGVSALLLPAGRLGDRYGRRRVYVAGFALVAIGALLCALAPSLAALIAARVVHGVGAACLMATGPALTTAAFAPSERGRALGMQATATYVGLTIGPALGGAIVSRAGWPALFLVSVPVALLGAALAHTVLEHDERATSDPYPLASAILVLPTLAAMLLGITHASALLGVAALGAIALAIVERRSPSPLLPRALLGERTLATGMLAALAQYVAVYVLLFALPFHLESRLAMTPEAAGVTMAAQPAAMALTTAASGWLSDRIGVRTPTVLGMLVLAGGLFAIARTAGDATLVTASLAITGLGSGLFTSPNASRVMGAAPPERRGTAAALLAEARNVGIAIGIAISGATYATDALDATMGVAIAVAIAGAVITAL
jgi:EmrB/QacA subfamily drug resistance transporter